MFLLKLWFYADGEDAVGTSRFLFWNDSGVQGFLPLGRWFADGEDAVGTSRFLFLNDRDVYGLLSLGR